MIIRNLEKNYVVIRACEGEGDAEQFLCQDPESRGREEYKLVRLPLAEVDGRLIAYLLKQMKSEAFSDFGDYFTDDEALYAVTRLGRGKRLDEKLAEENCSLPERLKLAERILTALVLLKQPPFFFRGAMAAERIRISPAGDVFFDYDLSQIREFERFVFADGALRLGGVFRVLFERELELKAFPEMEALICQLEQGDFEEPLEVHKCFLPIYEGWLEKNEGDLKPERFSFRLWERIKQCFAVMKKLAPACILILAFCYLIVSAAAVFREPETAAPFQNIGTLELMAPESTLGE